MSLSRRALLVSGTAAALAGCGGGSVPRDIFYRLGPAAAAAPLAGGPFRGTIEVPPFHAEGIINERAVLYRDGPRSLAQYSYHSWLEPPSVMVQRAFVEALRGAQAFATVATPEMRLDRDYELLGNIRQWEHVPSPPSASIVLDLSLRRISNNQEVLIKTYSANDTAADASVDGAVQAFTSGLDKVIAQFLADIAALPRG